MTGGFWSIFYDLFRHDDQRGDSLQSPSSHGDDFVVAGRKPGLLLATATLAATWFADETVLVNSDIIRADGLKMIFFDPIGFGLRLVVVCAAVTSTIDTSLLSPAVVIARNVVELLYGKFVSLITA